MLEICCNARNCPHKPTIVRYKNRHGNDSYRYWCPISKRLGRKNELRKNGVLIFEGLRVVGFRAKAINEQDLPEILPYCTYEFRHACYDLYLISDQWRQKRQQVFSRAKGICEQCKNSAAIHVHHLTYDNLYQEPLKDLMAVCFDCHCKFHPFMAENFEEEEEE